MPVFTRKHVSILVKDATGTPITATLGPGPGDFSYSGLEEGDVEALPIYNRGTYLEMVVGDQKQITGSITVYHDGDQTGTSVLDAIRKTGNTLTFNTCRFSTDWAEGKEGNQYSISFTCYEGVAIT